MANRDGFRGLNDPAGQRSAYVNQKGVQVNGGEGSEAPRGTDAPYLADADFVLWNCVVTSPPYWGLRDYGTGAWEGGDAECDHTPPKRETTLYVDGSGNRNRSN